MNKNVFIIGIFLLSIQISHAQPQASLKVSSIAWHGLTASEREFIQERYVVETMGPESFGVIIDTQGMNQSTPGTTGGANLGGAMASSAYIDKAFSENNDYSAKSHLAVILLGGLLGSVLDSKPTSQYQFRYAIRLGNGGITYQDQISTTPFRHPAGVCVSVPAITLLPEQHICTQTTESLRQAYIQRRGPPPATTTTQTINHATTENSSENPSPRNQAEEFINCKVNNLASVRTTVFKCNAIQGVIIQ